MRRSLLVASAAVLALSAPLACGSTGGDAADASGPASADDGAAPPPGSGANGDTLPDGAPAGDGAAGGDGGEEVDQGPPAVRFIGRFDTREATGPVCAWPGCRIIARFDGTAVSVRFDERAQAWMDGDPSEWDVAIDGTFGKGLVTMAGMHDYTLATGLPAGVHKVELYKRSEAQNGYTQFRGFDFKGGALLPPPRRASRRIEVFGDSSASGFGVLGVGQGPDCPGLDYAARWQNFRLTYGALLGERFGAEVHGTVYSGKGLAQNIWRPDTTLFGDLVGRSNPVDDDSVFDLASWQPDLLTIMLGGNDFDIGLPEDTTPTTYAQFLAKYRELVVKLRASYPNAHMMLLVSPSITDERPAGRSTRTNVKSAVFALAAERAGLGDGRVYAFEPAVATPAEMTGCNGHGAPALHQRIAGELATFARTKLSW